MRINPIIIFSILIVVFLLIGISVTVLMVKNGMNIYYISASVLLNILLFFTLYSINKGIPSSHKTITSIENNKDRLEFNERELIINSAVLEHKQIVVWNNIEAIYCLNIIPLEGTYHNFEYSIFLNQPARIVKYSNLSWYNRLFSSENNSLEIKVNDYNNIDFNKLHMAIEKYLINGKITQDYLHKNFGNDICPVGGSNTSTNFQANKLLNIYKLYKIYDNGNNTNNEKLKEYRTTAIKM
ncbi:hypothetical protein [Elizabethkingia anophelis]|uniref:hypothetical protein n=1 Tax=Elizabethkingia anophelis TaxID=1117645 RepID=UPI00099AE86B|nr:hypothetical protein [Elizabethkingia anophelis]MCT4287235.1 hypothetical protein [Elizabethkingia anophelis]OPC30659.1 hypothetical protein BAX98_08535 [Elizabethkingia anophelis]